MNFSSKTWLWSGFAAGVLSTVLVFQLATGHAQEEKLSEADLAKQIKGWMNGQTEGKAIGDFWVYPEEDLSKKLDSILKDQAEIQKRITILSEATRFIKNTAAKIR